MKPIIPQTRMNKTEARFAGEILQPMKLAGAILDYAFESVKLKLADNTYYTPDFFVVYPDHFEVIEVKGFWRDDARVKIKVAAAQFPYFRFKAVQLKNKQWGYETFNKNTEK